MYKKSTQKTLADAMEPLRKIIVKKYLPGFENLKKPDLLTKAEYQLVNECGLSDLLDVENNPVALERICEGEKLQTAEFYIRQEKIYNQNVAKIYRKDRVNPPQPRITRPAEVPVNVSNATTAVVPPPADINADVQSVPTEDARQPIRSAEGNSAAETDPYQMREEIATVATAMPSAIAVTGDDNFGSTDVDGARDFLELCTGVELPPMSARQTLTREMLMSQFPSMPSVLPIADNFREINVSDIGTPMFKKPLLTSTPFVKAAFPPEDQLAAALLPELPVLDAPMLEAPMPEIPIQTEPIMEAIGASNTPSTAVPTHMAESSSSGEVTNAPPPRARRNRQLGFTERLPLLNSTTSMPAARRSFDVFSFQYHACWNEMVQDVQMLLLQERERMESLREAPIMREAVPDQKDSGFQQTVDERFAIAQCEQSNMTSDGRKTQIHAVTEQSSGLKQLDVLMTPDLAMSSQPNQLDQLPSLDKNLTEVSNPYNLPTSIEPESTLIETPAAGRPHTEQEITVPPPIPTNLPKQNRSTRQNRREETVPVKTDSDSFGDISSILYNQAKQLETIPGLDEEPMGEIAPPDPMLLDILFAVQGELLVQRRRSTGDERVLIERLLQLLNIDTRIGCAKLMKNLILLKQANLVEVYCNDAQYIEEVALKLRQVQDSEFD